MNEELKIIISAEIDKLKQELQKGQKELKGFDAKASGIGKNVSKAFATMGKAVSASCKAAAAGVAALGAGMVAIAESTREFRSEQTLLSSAFETAGSSADIASNIYEQLYSVLGDSGAATEAALYLAQLTTNEKELNEWTETLTGIYAEFGKTIPTQELTEAISKTTKLGQVDGVLADVLAQAGIDLDDFNTQLFMCTETAERETLVREVLNNIYKKSAENYKKSAEEILNANKAQLALTKSLAECGKAVEPLITLFKQGLANTLADLSVGFEGLSKGLQDIVNNVEGGTERMSIAISGILNALIDKLTDILPTVLQMGLNIITSLIDGLTKALPSVIKAISNILPQVIKALGKLIPMVTEALLNAAPLIINTIFTVFAELTSTLGEILPEIVNQIIDILPAVIDEILNNIPVFIDACVNFLMSIVNAIPVVIVKLVQELPRIIDTILDAFLENMPLIFDASKQLFNTLIAAIPAILPALMDALPDIMNSVIDFLIAEMPMMLECSMELFMEMVKAIPLIIPELIEGIGQILSTITTSLVEKAPSIFSRMWQSITNIFGNAKDWFGDTFKAVYDTILGVFSNAKFGFGNVWENIKAGFGNVTGWFSNTFSTAWRAVKNVFSKDGAIFEGMKDGILDGLKAVINGLISGINKTISIPFTGISNALNSIKGVNIFGIKPFNWLPTISVPNIPYLENGGVLEKGQVGLLEGNGAEAVVPLEKNTKWLDRLADLFKTKLVGESQDNTVENRDIVLELDGKEFARASLKSINQLTKQTGKLDLNII